MRSPNTDGNNTPTILAIEQFLIAFMPNSFFSTARYYLNTSNQQNEEIKKKET